MGLDFFPAYVAVVLLASAAATKFFLVRLNGVSLMRGVGARGEDGAKPWA
jgi:hypothetical protein